MNWDAISAVADTVGTVAVLITLIYLAIQIRNSNKQQEIESYRHNWDGLNRMCELLSESTERASVVKRGRGSLDNLSDEEQIVFEFLHIRILNTIEAWHHQLLATSPPGPYRDHQLDNLAGVIVYIFNYPGTLAIWEKAKHTFVPIQELFDDSISAARNG
jgi:hypothetical protein